MKRLAYLVCTLAVSGLLIAQTGETTTSQGRGGGGGGGAPGGFGQGGGNRQQGKKTYEEVVTEDLATQSGVFKVHSKGDKLLFEIPPAMLGRDFLWVTEVQKTPLGGYNGTAANDRVVRWERREDKILLKTINYGIRATHGDAIKSAVEASNVQPIAMVFDVAADAKDGSAVIDVSRLFTSDPAEFSVRQTLGVGNVDSGRSFLDDAKAFPTNINVTSTLTFGAGAAPTGGGGGFGRGRSAGGPSNTAVVHYSIVLLPSEPMMGRLFDSRVGFFTESFQDYGTEENRVAEKQFITRYRLEKQDPGAALSEPVKPIVYYVSREVPEKWRQAMIDGVNDWAVAFEKAGFKNAIVGKLAPSESEDPSWSAEDARYSVIRWAPTPTENAMGPHVHDPRSGEIISAHIIIWHNVLKLAQDWYFAQASPNDKSAQKLPLPEKLMQRLVRYIVSHEVGHTLGLQHNFKASSTYTIANLRSPAFTRQFGVEASIMDYGRFNYVAQPGDGAELVPIIGPYDKFAIQWGYMPIPEAHMPEGETAALDRLAAEQVKNPMLRFGSNRSGGDPSQQSEDLGSDSVEATRLGFLNLKRVMGFLESAVEKPGKDYSDLEDAYGTVWGQFNTEMGHVLTVVGGVVMTDYHAGRGGAVYVPVSRERQAAAVKLLCDHVVKAPTWLTPARLLSKIQGAGAGSRIASAQNRVFGSLLSDSRLTKMFELEERDGRKAYTVREMVDMLRHEAFLSLATGRDPDFLQRQCQRSFVSALAGKLDSDASDVRALALAELRSLDANLASAAKSAKSAKTKNHYMDLSRSIKQALMLKQVVQAADPAASPLGGRRPPGG